MSWVNDEFLSTELVTQYEHWPLEWWGIGIGANIGKTDGSLIGGATLSGIIRGHVHGVTWFFFEPYVGYSDLLNIKGGTMGMGLGVNFVTPKMMYKIKFSGGYVGQKISNASIITLSFEALYNLNRKQ